MSDNSLEDEWDREWDAPEAPGGLTVWLVPLAALAAGAAWTGFYGWSISAELLAGADAQHWAQWIVNWSVPILLIATIWLLFMRNSRREAGKFADTAALLSRESSELEARLSRINRELSLAREFLGSQSLELESLGRVAGERISEHAAELQSLIAANGKQVDKISEVSNSALKNMSKLRDDLPVVANSAKDVSNQIGNSGRTAREQVEKLITGFERLNTFGEASDRQVSTIINRLESSIDGFVSRLDQLDAMTQERFDRLSEQSENYRTELDAREVDALAAMHKRSADIGQKLKELRDELEEAETSAFARLEQAKQRLHKEFSQASERIDEVDQKALSTSKKRLTALGDEVDRIDEMLAARNLKFDEEFARRQSSFETRESQASEVLEQRLAALDETANERANAQLALIEGLEMKGQALAGMIGQFGNLMRELTAQTEGTENRLSEGLAQLSGKISSSSEALATTEEALSEITDSSVRLLEIIQSGAVHCREDLPAAIAEAAQSLEGLENRAATVGKAIGLASSQGTKLGDSISQTQATLDEVHAAMKQAGSEIGENSADSLAKIQSLRLLLGRLKDESGEIAQNNLGQLKSAIAELDSATRKAIKAIEEGSHDAIQKAAEDLGASASAALESSLNAHSAEAVARLEQAASHASGVGREATAQLRDQLGKVNELVLNLEQRAARARELAQENVDNDFARRMALITDSLNSNAIDINQALSQDISDTAWSNYLKGDRGIFTRRAARLLEHSEAREIAELYQSDDTFREHVSRFIHDFEAMLRSLLSTRDGNALGVTVLGSDIGKLYVALAQSIERLRS